MNVRGEVGEVFLRDCGASGFLIHDKFVAAVLDHAIHVSAVKQIVITEGHGEGKLDSRATVRKMQGSCGVLGKVIEIPDD